MRRPALVAALALCCAASVQAAEGVAFADANGLVIVQVSVGDAPGTYAFVVDTGAQPCVVDDDLAASLDLELGGPRHGQGGAGEFVANHVVHPVRLGLPDGDQVRCVESIAIDLDEVGLQGFSNKLQGKQGALHAVFGNEQDARKLVDAIERANAAMSRLDRMMANADRQVFGPDGLMQDTRATVRQFHGVLTDARGSLQRVDAVLQEAQGIGANLKTGTADLGSLRSDVEANLRKVEDMINELNRRWPFAKEREVQLP
jgi:hypothetical protein